MDNKTIKFKNKVEVRILLCVYLVVFIPIFVLLIVSIIKNGFNAVWPGVPIFLICVIPYIGIILIINRYCITFDYESKEIRYTSYFSKTKVYKFSDIKIYYCKGKSTLPNDYVYNFIYNDNVVFKISSIDFEGQTKRSVDLLKGFFVGHQKQIYELEKEIKISDGNLFVMTYELEENIAIAYLPKGVSIDLSYKKSEQKFYLTVRKEQDWDNQLEVVEVSRIEDIKDVFQILINKYSI